MRRFRAMTAGMMLATAALGACDQYEIRKKDSPDPAPAAAPVPAQSEQDKAIIAATPQVSLSEKDRREIEGVARNYLDEAAKELAKGFSPMPGVQDVVVALQPTQVHVLDRGSETGRDLSFHRRVRFRMFRHGHGAARSGGQDRRGATPCRIPPRS